MGNKHCCDAQDQQYQQTFQNEKIVSLNLEKNPERFSNNPPPLENKNEAKDPKVEENNICPPFEADLSEEVKNVLENYKELDEKINKNQHTVYFGQELYVGQIDSVAQKNQIPEGKGKIKKADGSVYLGDWKRGKADGRGVYIMKNGSYYDGQFVQNKAEGIGKFCSKSFNYQGHFVENKFHGKGSEKSDDHTFEGYYFEGYKQKGTLSWKEGDFQYEYYGKFNFANEFEGQGILKEPKGVYKGEFLKGEKHGKGVYEFENGLKYEGDYVHGKKEGTGTLFNHGGTISYTGQFQDDLPHGQGEVMDKEGKRVAKRWIKGLDSELVNE